MLQKMTGISQDYYSEIAEDLGEKEIKINLRIEKSMSVYRGK